MRVVASVQSKRGSSRGLVHYIAHSKIDSEREPGKGRGLFNAFTDELSVKSANNSIKADIVRGRPSNGELHHLVLSFRPEDYQGLGSTEKYRKAALKETTRAAMKRLENALDADRIAWAAAVHLNTENPHVHIAIQKEFLARDMEPQFMTQIPREALPHFEHRDGEKVLVPGILIEAATEKMEQLIAMDRERVRTGEREQTRNKSGSVAISRTDGETDGKTRRKGKEERDVLRRGILAEHELHLIESRIDILTDQGHKMRFRVTDPVSGQKRRPSLRDLERHGAGSDAVHDPSPARQLRTILFKMLTKEEAVKERLQRDSAKTIREANGVKKLYKKNGWKLPIPSLTKDELDRLQNHSLEESNIRKFSYLESIRTDRVMAHEIESRSKEDLERLRAWKSISEMRYRLLEKNHADLKDRQYYCVVALGDKRVSLAQLDREENASTNPVFVFAQKLKETALRLVGKGKGLAVTNENKRLTNDIVSKLNEQLSGIKKDQQSEENKVKILEKILTTSTEKTPREPVYSSEQLAEMEMISLRLKREEYYDKSWNEQRILIESAGSDSPASRKLLRSSPSADFNAHKIRVIAGRALAREIIARIEFEKAKEDLKVFTESKRFQKFAVADKKTGKVAFLSLYDVDLSGRGSALDRAMEELFEGREHRALRRTTTSLVKGREQRLKNEVDAARDLVDSVVRNASEFKQSSIVGLRSEPIYRPMFTSSELAAIEKRASKTKDPTEAVRLQKVLESAADRSVSSLKETLRDFENRQTTYTQSKELDPVVQTAPERIAIIASEGKAGLPVRAEKAKEPKFQGHSR